MRQHRHKNGFTLIELVVYIALVTVIALITTNSILIFNRSLVSLRLDRRLSASAETALRRIIREAHLAKNIYASSTLNVSPGVLSLESKESETDGAAKDVMIYISDGALMLRRATSSPIVLTSGGITVTNLVFRQINNSTISKSVKAELTLSASSGTTSTTKNYYITTILRGSY